VVWESGAILRYLCAEHSAGALWPTDPRQRAGADQWMEWNLSSLQPPLMGFFWGWYRTPEAQRNVARNAALLAAMGEQLAKLDALLATRPYIGGDHFTFGDMPSGTLMYRYHEMEIERPSLPHLEAWYARLQERPAYRGQVMRPFDDLKGRVGY
jgi:glutathione S-transferase